MFTSVKPAFMELACLLACYQRALLDKDVKVAWAETYEKRIRQLIETIPSGSGFDSGHKLDWSRSKPNRIIICTAYHHMHESGMYDGWTSHDVIIKPSLTDWVDIRITGRNRNEIKDLIDDLFITWCLATVEIQYEA